MTFRPGQGWGWRAGRLIWVIAFRRAVLLNGIARRTARRLCRPLLRVELDALGNADRLAEAGPRAVGEGPP